MVKNKVKSWWKEHWDEAMLLIFIASALYFMLKGLEYF